MKTTIQLNEFTKKKLELLKKDGDTFEDVIKKLIPEGVSEYTIDSIVESPAFTVHCWDCDIDPSLWEENISWGQLRADPVGTEYFATPKGSCTEEQEISAKIVFKDDRGVVVLFRESHYHEHYKWDKSPNKGKEETIEWLERFTFL